MKLIPFSTNSYNADTHFMISDEDYEKVTAYKWRVSVNGGSGKRLEVRRNSTKEEIVLGAPIQIKLHRFILGLHLKKAKKFEEVDHLDRNTFNNQRENLLDSTTHGNSRNRKNNIDIGEGLWGAYFALKRGSHKKPWRSQISCFGKYISVGYFATELEAHIASKEKYKEVTGVDHD